MGADDVLLVAEVSGHACKGMVHRNIKMQNILAASEDGRFKAKLADWGAAIHRVGAAANKHNKTQIGTIGFLPPEMVQGRPQSQLGDVYSLGATACYMVAGGETAPLVNAGQTWCSFKVDDNGVVQDVTGATQLAKWLEKDDGVPGVKGGLRHLLAWMCRVDPAERPTAFDALCHEYMLGC
jgi:serine/threonine protein kinase